MLTCVVMALALQTATPHANGLWGWGVGLDMPHVGPQGLLAAQTQAGWGYILGAGVSYEIGPRWLVRLQLSQTDAMDVRGYVSFVSGGTRDKLSEVAQWRALLGAAGAAYFWPWTHMAPFVGADLLTGYGGYTYTYTGVASTVLAPPPTGPPSPRPAQYAALGWLGGAALRAGVRLPLRSWLHAFTEVGLQWLPLGNTTVAGSREIRDVRTVSQHVFLPYFAFTLRCGL